MAGPHRGRHRNYLKAPTPKLIELGRDFERLLAIEEPLHEETERLWNAADQLRYEKLGIDPDDKEACQNAINHRYREWMEARDAADDEVGYHEAWRRMNRASGKTAAVAKKIFKAPPPITPAGLLVRVRVIEAHGEIFNVEPFGRLADEVRDFAKRMA
jgi:hypothetical protein